VPDPLRPQFLHVLWKGHQGVDGPLGQELHGLSRGIGHPGDVLLGRQSHIGGHAREEHVVGRSQPVHRDGFPLQVADRADPLRPEQLEAANMHACQQDKRVPGLQLQEKRHAEMQREVDLAGGKSRLLVEKVLFLDVLHLSEPLRLQEGFGHVLGSYTNGADIPD
jgi:hypothetical protein